MSFGYGILVGRKVVETSDPVEWSRARAQTNRQVARTVLNQRRRIIVSTVFLGIDHGYREKLWFETMVFGTSIHEACDRYATWEEAERGHARMVARARQARQVRNRDWSPAGMRRMNRSVRRLRRRSA